MPPGTPTDHSPGDRFGPDHHTPGSASARRWRPRNALALADRLFRWADARDWAGPDPYDGLTGPLGRRPCTVCFGRCSCRPSNAAGSTCVRSWAFTRCAPRRPPEPRPVPAPGSRPPPCGGSAPADWAGCFGRRAAVRALRRPVALRVRRADPLGVLPRLPPEPRGHHLLRGRLSGHRDARRRVGTDPRSRAPGTPPQRRVLHLHTGQRRPRPQRQPHGCRARRPPGPHPDAARRTGGPPGRCHPWCGRGEPEQSAPRRLVAIRTWPATGLGGRLPHRIRAAAVLQRAGTLLGMDVRVPLNGANHYLRDLFDGPLPRYFAGGRTRRDPNNDATAVRMAAWAAERGFAATDFAYAVLAAVVDRYPGLGTGTPSRRSCLGNRPLWESPRWSVAPLLDALTALHTVLPAGDTPPSPRRPSADQPSARTV